MAAVQPGHGAADLLSLGQENPPPCSKVPAEGRLRPSGEVVRWVGGGEGKGPLVLGVGEPTRSLQVHSGSCRSREHSHVLYVCNTHRKKKLVSEEAQKSAHSSQSDA